MTDNEIIKALKCCVVQNGKCEECPCESIMDCDCEDMLLRNTFDLIIRQKNEIISRTEEYNDMLEQRNKVEEALEVMTMDVNSLTSERDALNEMVAEQKAEIERLQHILVSFMSEVENWEHKHGIDTSNIPKIAVLGTEKENCIKQAKSEAYGEFAAELYNNLRQYENYDTHHTYEILDRIESVEEFLLNKLVELTRNLHGTCTESNE